MGSCTFKDAAGVEVPLEYTMGFIRDVGGRLRLEVHYLSIPFNAKVNSTWAGVAAVVAGVGGAAVQAERVASGGVTEAGETILQVGHTVQANVWNVVAGIFACFAAATVAYFACAWDSHTSRSGLGTLLTTQLASMSGTSDVARGVAAGGGGDYGRGGGYGGFQGYGGGYTGSTGGGLGGGQKYDPYRGGGYQNPYDSWQGPPSAGGMGAAPSSGSLPYGGRSRRP
eukprot:SRR837773.7121.p1 GENE.SRR837773.7121~~SRR837773.7121.p1  ORF type:complete len:226 (-),score=11.15 SRR837773.7121:76-753(-)